MIPEPAVTWVKLETPHVDFVGFLLACLTIVALLAAIALVLGTALGVLFILRSRRLEEAPPLDAVSLHLGLTPPSA